MSLERLDIVHFLSAPTIPTVKFVFRQPSLSYQNNLFILPFKPKVWYCIFGLTIFIFIIALINAKWESIKMAQEDNNVSSYLISLLILIHILIFISIYAWTKRLRVITHGRETLSRELTDRVNLLKVAKI